MSKVLHALPPPEQSQASQALPTACPPTLHCRQLTQPVVALYNWAWEIGTGERGIHQRPRMTILGSLAEMYQKWSSAAFIR